MFMTEVCSCGASLQIPSKKGMKHLREWRQTHVHRRDPEEKHPEGNNFATVGFSSRTTEPEMIRRDWY